MKIGFGNFLDRVENGLNNFSKQINNVASTAASAAVGTLAKAQSIAQVNSLIPGLKSTTSSLATRAGFPTNPLSLSNLANIGRLLIGTLPLTNKLLPDLVEDGTIEQYPKNGGLDSSTKVFLVNGIATNDGARADMGNQTSQLLNKNVQMVNNSTAGPALDLVQCVEELVFAIPNKATKTLSNEIYKNLTSNPPSKMELIGYSQGTIITTHAISMAITKMKQNGYSDDQIKDLMSKNVTVALGGCPVDLNNPAHTITNVPPGMAGPGTKKISDYFTTSDRQLFGKGPNFTEQINKETGAGELSKPNFEMVRHDKDLVATTVHDITLKDLGDIIKNPVSGLTKLAANLLDDIGSSLKDTGNPVGYHMYDIVYAGYMAEKGIIK